MQQRNQTKLNIKYLYQSYKVTIKCGITSDIDLWIICKYTNIYFCNTNVLNLSSWLKPYNSSDNLLTFLDQILLMTKALLFSIIIIIIIITQGFLFFVFIFSHS